MSTINSRIQDLVNHFSNGNNSDFGGKIGVNEANIRNYIGGTEPKFNFIEKICKVFEVSFEWLILGKGEMLDTKLQPLSSQPQENDNEIISLLRDKIALLESNNQLQQDKIAYLEQRLELAELKDKEAMALKIKKQRKEIDQKDEIINLQNE